ncbi:peptide deformylase [Candidatus Omnitrophota bacterium]
MPILNIKTYPADILRKTSSAVKNVGDEERKLAYDMIETMRHAEGVGLAAPQIGITKRIIVIEDIENHASALVLVNPKIVKKKGRSRFCEGCLSVPEVTSEIARPEFIALEALNLDGEKLKIETRGLLSRIIQHEIDHLDGILFIDRIALLKRKHVIKNICSKESVEL